MNIINKVVLGALGLGMGLSLTSCSDYLDTEKYFDDEQSLERIFNEKDYTMQFLAYCYSMLQGDNIEVGDSRINITNYSDDQVFNEANEGSLSAGGRYSAFKMGQIGYNYSYNSLAGWYIAAWPWSYDGIRQASIFIHNAHANELLSEQDVADLKAQARFLRAYFYWMLVRRYGPVPIVPEEGVDYTKSYDDLSLPRNTMDECVDFITSELALAAQDLPDKRDNANIVRPTKGAALAVRAKVLVYAASPLFNGNTEMADFTDNTGKVLIPQTYDESKWAKAAAACRDMIDYCDQTGAYRLYTAPVRSTGGSFDYPNTITPPHNDLYSDKNFPEGWANIDPYESYRSLFNGELYAADNPELIFTRGINMDNTDLRSDAGISSLVHYQLPPLIGGYNSHGMTQKQCDAYDMADGSAFDREKVMKKYADIADEEWVEGEFTATDNDMLHPYDHLPKDVWMGYANREPRFYASVAYNGYRWCANSATTDKNTYQYKQAWYYRGESAGRTNGNDQWNPTGIGICKFVHPADCEKANGSVRQKIEPALRYADVLLLYAEALNNLSQSYTVASWDGKQTYTVSRDVEQMRRGVKPVRMRAGVPDYTDAVYGDKDAFFKAIVHERQIEFFGENQRYYDLRRWKLAPQEEAETVMGCNTLMDKKHRSAFYTPVRVPNIQTTFSRKQYFWPITYDELKKNKNMTQAPGWQDYD